MGESESVLSVIEYWSR